MQRKLLPMIVLIGISTCSFAQSDKAGQSAGAETQTLQALLNEVRALRQELRASLNRTQSAQILLARFQIQEGVTARAADRFNEAREKLLDAQTHQKELALEQKRLEDSPPATDPQQQSDMLDRLTHVKSELEVLGHSAQQRQAAETQAEQQLRDEQDKLNALENQLDELIAGSGNSNSKAGENRP